MTPHATRFALRAGAATIIGSLALGALTILPADAHTPTPTADAFLRVATYPVFQNLPADLPRESVTVAEISTVTEDGRTMIYTDALGQRIGFLDISNPAAPLGLGSISLVGLGGADDEPTSVAVSGPYLMVVVDTSGGDFTSPSGRLDVFRLSDRTRVASFDMAGQPDSIAISKDRRYAAIAIENQRDESATADGGLGKKGDLPQLPAGFVQILDLQGTPQDWGQRRVELVAADGSALPAFVAAGIAAPSDPEPEYVSINARNKLALTLQENNGVVIIDLTSGAIESVFSAGSATVTGIDTAKDKTISLTGSITAAREPDSVGWIDNRYLATANEGDWRGGSRGWSVFDSVTGGVVWDAGNSFEYLAETLGLHNEARAAKKGAEPEGLLISTIRGKRYGFVGSERSNFIAVYDLSDPVSPRYLQALAATNGPEGILAIPSRGLLAVSSEKDEASEGVRASISLYQLGALAGSAGSPAFPSIVSDSVDGVPIGWGALGALTASTTDPDVLYTANDSAYSPSRIFPIDTTQSPAILGEPITVTRDGVPIGLDIEGLHAREQGGFWLAGEGATGAANGLYLTDASGAILRIVRLPETVSSQLGKWGLEGVTAITDESGEHVWVALQRELSGDPVGIARIGRYDVATGQWSFFGYRLESASSGGSDWIGLSEIVAVDADTLAVVERDKLNGPDALIKRIYTVRIPDSTPAAGELPVLAKSLALDVLPALRATKGWTQEKLEGLTIGGNGRVYAITDNDGLKDSTGETVFLDLGAASKVFGITYR